MESVVPATGEVNFSMDEGAASTLVDVVVVGYGTQRRANVTGAISTIKTKELVQSPVADLAIN